MSFENVRIVGSESLASWEPIYDCGRYGIVLADFDGGWLLGTQVCGTSLGRIGTASTSQSRWSGMMLRGTATLADENVITEVGRESYAAIHLWQLTTPSRSEI